jgi:RNA polymerase sigma-70 factor, ECF subfamily
MNHARLLPRDEGAHAGTKRCAFVVISTNRRKNADLAQAECRAHRDSTRSLDLAAPSNPTRAQRKRGPVVWSLASIASIIGQLRLLERESMADAEFATLIHAQRGYLLRVAVLQLRDSDLAEDVVQDTLLAALQGAGGFSGRSSLKTWLTGILKHKIVDAIRKKGRGPIISSLDEECQIDDFDALFDELGHWENPPATWGDPEGELSRRQFFDVVDFCLEKLPPNTARVFMMREVMELDGDEICKELSITSTNLWVILYRARVALRQCLEQNWFAQGGRTA